MLGEREGGLSTPEHLGGTSLGERKDFHAAEESPLSARTHATRHQCMRAFLHFDTQAPRESEHRPQTPDTTDTQTPNHRRIQNPRPVVDTTDTQTLQTPQTPQTQTDTDRHHRHHRHRITDEYRTQPMVDTRTYPLHPSTHEQLQN